VLEIWLGKAGLAFLVLLAGYLLLSRLAPNGIWALLTLIGVVISGLWLAIRLLRLGARHAVWRLRNRLLVTYLFIAVVPVLLLATLAVVAGLSIASQLAVYLATSELDRQIASLGSAADSLVRTAPAERATVLDHMAELFYRDRFPGFEVIVRDSGHVVHYPAKADTPPAPGGWKRTQGILRRGGSFYIWSHRQTDTGDVTVTAPVTSDFLASLAPDLGVVDLRNDHAGLPSGNAARHLPDPVNRFDTEVLWFANVPVSDWDRPAEAGETALIAVHSRISALLNTVFNRKTDLAQSFLQSALIVVPVLFLIVEGISMLIGISMTRTITGAVHRLYEGTERVMQGDFSHRIEVTGNDQLADLSRSFNRMTENVERLLVVAKEKERLQSEIEIAREVQNQLYPRSVPQTPSLRLKAVCQPARMVSGDYYDYETVDKQVALAIGDVAGKGISAALLMATLQSALRTQLQDSIDPLGACQTISTSRLVSRLNRQLCAYTTPEKYATFCLGVYDEGQALLTYTNAGHLPPLLVRNGELERLEVTGTVVGAFPFSTYGESCLELKSGDLLVCFTDGITEPENEYGEMFGEERLNDLVARNAHRSEDQIIQAVIESVHDWTASEELQDDMTILVARKV